MSIVQGGKIIAGNSISRPDLFDYKWSDHVLNNIQWLRADTFSWQSGAVYEAAYQHLVDDITPIIDQSNVQSETISGTTIYFRVASDGHKICTSDQEGNVAAIYTATGVAWYYIIDLANQRFKLPRTTFGFTGLRDTVGKYVAESLPNITAGNFLHSDSADGSISGACEYTRTASNDNARFPSSSRQYNTQGVRIKASLGSSTYQDDAPVQQRATQMYLYFYVGNFTQTALENTAGLNTELFNNKVDVGHQVIDFQAPTAGNNYTWYRKYADGWVEQGGIKDMGTVGGNTGISQSVSLPVEMTDTNYTIQITRKNGGSGYAQTELETSGLGTTTFSISVWNNVSGTATIGSAMWQVSGMAA